MRMRTPLRVAAAAASFALLITACGGGGGDGDGETDTGTGAGESTADPDNPSGGTFSHNLTEPSYLAPASECYESECKLVLTTLNDPLVSVDGETQELVYDGIAEEIASEDNTVWTIKLKPDRTFQNGEPINADTLIDTWNYTANPKNEADTAGFMARIEGAGQGGTLGGLRKVDDLTVKVTLSGAFSQFGQQMSYLTAFTPMAPACLADIDACNEKPIGSGPYMIQGQWNHDEGITVTRWEDYNGDRVGQADTIEFTIFADLIAAFRAWQGGTLDIVDDLDPTIYAEGVQAAGERLVETDTSSLTYMGFPTKTKPFDSKEYRQGISMAFDRKIIVDNVLNGLRTPSTAIVTPPLPGWRDDACEYCEFDPERAKQLFEQGGGKAGDTVELWFNSGAGHEGWVEAVGNELKNNLGLTFRMKGTEWAQYLEILDAGNFTGPFRLGWGADYASMENFLRPIVGTDGDSNYSDFSNKQVDDLLVQGDRAATPEDAIKFYQQGEDVALEEMPIIPLWSTKRATVWSENVGNVLYDPIDDEVELLEVVVANP